jgi:hypothetical protein
LLIDPIFPYWSEFTSDDDSNFLEDDIEVLQTILNFYGPEEMITSNSIKLIQTSISEHLFIVDSNTDKFDIVKVSKKQNDNGLHMEIVSSIKKLVSNRKM